LTEDFRVANERRAYTRLALKMPVELRQGNAGWTLELFDISLTGLAVSEPDDWNADYSRPFRFVIRLQNGNKLEFNARLVHINPGHMGFEMDHLEEEQLVPLAKLLASGLGKELIEEELALLRDSNY